MIKLIIYDLDGTLIDSSQDIADAVNWALAQKKIPPFSETVIRAYVGNGVRQLIRSVLDKAIDFKPDELFIEEVAKLYRGRYADHLLDKTKLYPGVTETLEYFKDKKQAVITNKPAHFSRQILQALGIEPYFFRLIGEDQTFARKPSPDSTWALMDSVGVRPEETIFVGDSVIDIETARNAGIQSVAVTYGFEPLEKIKQAKPNFWVDRLEALQAVCLNR